MAETKTPKPAPKSRYGPSFDEIERRDPVQWHAAHRAWVRKSFMVLYSFKSSFIVTKQFLEIF